LWYCWLSVITYCREKLARFETHRPFLKQIALVGIFGVFGIGWVITMASFIYGMTVDARVGGRF
jgi:hypothetical protein